MKKTLYVVMLMIVFMIVPTFVFADDLAISGNAVAIRNAPTTVNSLIVRVNSGATYPLKSKTIVADQGKNGDCNGGWYNIDYSGQSAYVCAKYGVVKETSTPVISVEAKNQCEQELKAAGFPQEYWNGLCTLKAAHPNWTFNAVQTGYNFVDVVNAEAKCGVNSLVTTNPEYIDSSCTSKLDTGYKHASQKAVAHYLNPLNYLTEKKIFMFESNYRNPAISAESNIKIVNGIIPSYVGQLPTLPNAINDSCIQLNMSASLISSRIRQELGPTGLATSGAYKGKILSCISGEYTKRWGEVAADGHSLDYYYNFFNANVVDGSNNSAAYRAVHYAYKKNWGGTGNQTVDLSLSISGGISFLKNNYLDKNQYTMYFQKFNVAPLNTAHQYMSNLAAPSSEADIAYSGYKNAGLLDSPFIFYIPIYSNLDAPIVNSPDGATGESGDNTSGGLAVSTIIVNSGYKVSGNYVMGINAGTSLDDFKNKIGALGGTVISSSTEGLGTGTVVAISNGTTQDQYTVVIKGDTSGDGMINALDLLQVQKNILGQYNMSGANILASDPSGDGKIDALDLLQIQKNILGQYTIAQ